MPQTSQSGYLDTIGGQPSGAIPSSGKRFADGAQYRIEIPSVEGPSCLAAVISTAADLDVVVHRVSQGSGVQLMTDRELREMAALAEESQLEVSLFARPGASWAASAMARSTAGASIASAAWGSAQVAACLEDAKRAAEFGFRSVLIADLGVLACFAELRKDGALPHDMQAKISVMLPVTNPATAKVLADFGANTLNLATDLPLSEIAAIRSAVDIPLDIYVESPDNVGGFLRHHEIPELIRIAAPVYLKFGLRNAPDVYPCGTHLDATAVALVNERVRRARLGLELLARSGFRCKMSKLAAEGLAIPTTREWPLA